MKQLRIYTLKDAKSAEVYFHQHWPKHMISLPKFGIFINDVYLGCNEQANQVIAIVTFPEKCDTDALNKKYMSSEDFINDMDGFDMSNIIGVSEISINERLF